MEDLPREQWRFGTLQPARLLRRHGVVADGAARRFLVRLRRDACAVSQPRRASRAGQAVPWALVSCPDTKRLEIVANLAGAPVAIRHVARQQLRNMACSATGHRPSSSAGGRRARIRCSSRRVSGAWNGWMPLTIS